MLVLTGHAQVSAALADQSLVVPPVPDTGPPGGIGWLRAAVPRFSSGAVHQHRRSLAEAELRALAPATLRSRARELAERPDTVAVEVLAEALGVTVAPDVVVRAARAYQPQVDASPADDEAVAQLVAALGGVPDEATAARACLLVQACDATAGLIRNALPHKDCGAPAEVILLETLRHAPPVRATRRRAPDGTLMLLDIAAANRDPAVFADPERFDVNRVNNHQHLTFGVGLRPCPGHNHALAIAAGALEGGSR